MQELKELKEATVVTLDDAKKALKRVREIVKENQEIRKRNHERMENFIYDQHEQTMRVDDAYDVLVEYVKQTRKLKNPTVVCVRHICQPDV